jgi:sugar lactone lactonase YvrE
MTETRLVADGLGFPESTRWHDGRVWVCNWGAGEVLAVTTAGEREVMARIASQTIPFSIDWLPDGRLLVVDGPRQKLLRQDWDGALEPVADFSGLGAGPFNELVVNAAGSAYVNGGSGSVVCVHPDGTVRQVAGELKWPNGMALLADERILVVADSHAEQLLAFDVDDDGMLSDRRVWAELEHAPDGICADADGAVWVAASLANTAYAWQRAARFSPRLPRTEGALRACSAAKTGGRCSSRRRSGAEWRRR